MNTPLRTHGVRVGRVLSSPWCRCLETARLMAVGPVETSWALVPDREPTAGARLRELKEIVSGWRGPGTLVLEITVLKPKAGSPAGASL